MQAVARWLLTVVLLASPITALAGGAETLTNETIVTLAKSGMGDPIITELMKRSRCQFDTSVTSILDLKAKGLSDGLIATMMQTMGAQSVADPGNIDPNDPMAPHLPGIYLCETTPSGARMTQLEPANASEQKTSTAASIWTGGLAKVKIKAVLRGSSAVVRSTSPQPTFYFYFDVARRGPASVGTPAALFGGSALAGALTPSLSQSGVGLWSIATSPNEFVLVQPTVKEGARELVVGQANAFGSQVGTLDKYVRNFTFDKVADGVYKAIPSAPLPTGEYCFYAGGGEGGGSYGKVFDFGIDAAPPAPPALARAVAPPEAAKVAATSAPVSKRAHAVSFGR